MYDVLYIGDTVEYFVVIKKITRACARFFISIGAHIGTYMSLNQTDAPEKTKRVDDSLAEIIYESRMILEKRSDSRHL